MSNFSYHQYYSNLARSPNIPPRINTYVPRTLRSRVSHKIASPPPDIKTHLVGFPLLIEKLFQEEKGSKVKKENPSMTTELKFIKERIPLIKELRNKKISFHVMITKIGFGNSFTQDLNIGDILLETLVDIQPMLENPENKDDIMNILLHKTQYQVSPMLLLKLHCTYLENEKWQEFINEYRELQLHVLQYYQVLQSWEKDYLEMEKKLYQLKKIESEDMKKRRRETIHEYLKPRTQNQEEN